MICRQWGHLNCLGGGGGGDLVHARECTPAVFWLAHCNRMVDDSEAVNDTAREAEGRRELTQHGVLPCLAGGKGWGGGEMICTLMRCPPYRLPWHTVPPALPRSCSAGSFLHSQLLLLLYITKCTQKTNVAGLTQGRQGPVFHVQYDSSLVTPKKLSCQGLLYIELKRSWKPEITKCCYCFEGSTVCLSFLVFGKRGQATFKQ